jgi:hypothetical protein
LRLGSKLSDLTITRNKIFELEAAIHRELVPIDCPVSHYFSDGVYAREMRIPAGTVATGKVHKTLHLNILSQGDVSVMTESGIKRIQAPATIVSPPGTKRAVYAHTDVVWTTIHGTHETDLEKLEADLIETVAIGGPEFNRLTADVEV